MSAPAPSQVPGAAATLAPVSTWRQEARAQLRLALPVIVLQVGLMLMGVVDTAMMGRVSEVEMSAVGIGHAWHFMALSFGLGVLQVLDPFVSQAFGARDEPAISRAMQRGLLLALLLSVPCSAVILCARPALEAFGQPDNIVPSAVRFCQVSVVGVPGFLLFVALRQSLQAQHRLRPLVLTIVVANLLNAGLDWVLIFGHLGAPALGAVGCAWATAVSRLAQVGLLFFFGGALLTPHLRPLRKSALQVGPLLRMLKVGLPIGVQFALEIGAFNIVSLLMGRLGAEPARLGPATVSDNPASAAVGGHMVALNLAALAFMVPLGMSMAASVRVGNAIGRSDPPATRRAARIALQQALLFMAATSAAFLLFPEALARAYTDSAGTVAVAVTLIPLAGVFGMFDGLQVVAGGCLRGAADTRFAMIAHLLGFWAFGIPLGWWLAFRGGYGPAGLWWGLVAGLAAVAVVLYARVRWRLAGVLERLRVEDHEQELLA